MRTKADKVIRVILHTLEFVIAVLTLIVLVGMLGLEIYRMCTVSGYFNDLSTFLHNVLSIVVGLEFVRMLIDMTPANTLEVLIVAISRHVILTHDNPLTILVCVLCVAALFATRRYFIRKEEVNKEFSEVT